MKMVFLILFALALTAAYLYSQHLHSYWSRHGFKQLDTTFFIGNAWPLLSLKTSLGEFFSDLYKKHKEHKLLGIYFTYRPILVVNDPILLQNIFIRDFTSFHDRSLPFDEANDPLSGYYQILF